MSPEGAGGTIKFVLMSRSSNAKHSGGGSSSTSSSTSTHHNQQHLTTISIPADSEMVAKMRCREKEEEAEKNRVKHLTLKMTERLELEEEALELQQQVGE